MDEKDKTFYAQLKASTCLDLRDNRGKRHCISLVLFELVGALLSNRDGSLSSIHEHMVQHHKLSCKHLGLRVGRAISRAQLPVLLAKVNMEEFSRLIISTYGYKLGSSTKSWIAADGKELRGSVVKSKGEKRACAIIQFVTHTGRQLVAQRFCLDRQESESKAVQQLLKEGDLSKEKISMDSLHLSSKNTKLIHGNKGSYLLGLKRGTAKLFQLAEEQSTLSTGKYKMEEKENKHGRKVTRSYSCYAIGSLVGGRFWKHSGIQTLIRVERVRATKQLGGRTGKEPVADKTTVNYYLSNIEVADHQCAEELYQAVRGHWQIEVNNHLRDVTLKEDQLYSSKPLVNYALAYCRSIALELLSRITTKNRRAQLDYFSADFKNCLLKLKQLQFL